MIAIKLRKSIDNAQLCASYKRFIHVVSGMVTVILQIKLRELRNILWWGGDQHSRQHAGARLLVLVGMWMWWRAERREVSEECQGVENVHKRHG